jgi:hypothetical protein
MATGTTSKVRANIWLWHRRGRVHLLTHTTGSAIGGAIMRERRVVIDLSEFSSWAGPVNAGVGIVNGPGEGSLRFGIACQSMTQPVSSSGQ